MVQYMGSFFLGFLESKKNWEWSHSTRPAKATSDTTVLMEDTFKKTNDLGDEALADVEGRLPWAGAKPNWMKRNGSL